MKQRMEILWSFPTTNIEEYGEIDWKVKVDSKNVSLERSADGDCNLKVSQALDERATWLYRTCPSAWGGRGCCRGDALRACCRGVSEEEEVERTEECKRGFGAICLWSAKALTKAQEVVVYLTCFEIGGEKCISVYVDANRSPHRFRHRQLLWLAHVRLVTPENMLIRPFSLCRWLKELKDELAFLHIAKVTEGTHVP
ncbi:unnamed protein product [Arabidopsis arenosa]|uniref:Uncharacterized protein n=1 Tax=Arabidopsis arenosa TaxID=38785 RepID=A0A8S2ARG8_ARAAE|nr:unnamed protein product [Arabidopsis arenosa]